MVELLFLNGPRSGERMTLNAKLIRIGSAAENTVVIVDASVAPIHAILEFDGEAYRVRIHESRPPVALNGRQVVQAQVKDGDRLRVGNVEFRCFVQVPRTTSKSPNPFQSMFEGKSMPSPAGEAPLSLDDAPSRESAVRTLRNVPTEPASPGRNWKGILVALGLLGLMLGGSLLAFRKELWKRSAVRNAVEHPFVAEDEPEELPMPRCLDDLTDVGTLGALPIGPGPSDLREGYQIHRTSKYGSHQAAVLAARPGDSVIFDTRDDRPVLIQRPIRDVQFISGSAKWEVHADLIDCQFIYHTMPEFLQRAGRLHRCVFFRCPMAYTHLIHTDTVSMYFDQRSTLSPRDNGEKGLRPILQLTGYVRNVLIHQPYAGSPTQDKRWDMRWNPSIRIDATSVEGDGHGTYILSPVVWGQRAWTPHQIVRGRRITYAHLTTDHNVWADPVLDVARGTECVVLATAIGGENPATADRYTTPRRIKYHDHDEWGHDLNGPPYRGAVMCIQGFGNRIVAHGDARKPWSVGHKLRLPAQHFVDGIVAADPFLQQFATERGGVSINFGEHRGYFVMLPTKDGTEFLVSPDPGNGSVRYPLRGTDLIAPVFVPLKDLRINAGEFDKLNLIDMTGKPVAEIEKLLAKDQSIYLGAGTYEMTRTVTSGFICGAGMDRTILKWPAGSDCTQRSCRGLINCTISGGRFGYNSQAGVGTRTGAPTALFLRTRFQEQAEACVNLHTTQYQTWQDCEFTRSKVGFTHGLDRSPGVYTGDKGASGGTTVDHVNFANCAFRKITGKALALSPNSNQLGHVGIHHCVFDEVGDAAISLQGGQTHLIQGCKLTRVGRSSYAAPIDVLSHGTVVVSHCDVDSRGVKGNPICVRLRGLAVVSHCNFQGMPTSLKCDNIAMVDHVRGDGNVDVPRDSLLCQSQFKNSDLAQGVSLATRQGFSDVTAMSFVVAYDNTPPSEPLGLRVRTVDKQKELSWKAAEDPESGIARYILFAQDREIGRTAYEYVVPAEGHGPMLNIPVALKYHDSDPINRGYRVVAVNGAGLGSEGTRVPPRSWGAARPRYFDKAGNEIQFVRFSETKGKVTGVVLADGTVIPLSKVGNDGLPGKIYFDPGLLLAP